MPCPRHYATRLQKWNNYYPGLSQHKLIHYTCFELTAMKSNSLYYFRPALFTRCHDSEVCSCSDNTLLTFIATSGPQTMDRSLTPHLQWTDTQAVSSVGCL